MDLKSIDDLRPAPYNPRKIGKKASAGLAKSLKSFEDISGIVWNQRTGHLVTGHQRVDRLRELGAKLVNGALELNGERWAVRVVDWPESKEKSANVAANNPHVAGEFSDGLGDILADIKLSIGDDDFMELRLDALEMVLPDADLGDGTIDEKDTTKRFAVFVLESDGGAKKKLIDMAESMGGYAVECSDENCNVSVRELDPNTWARRREKLNSQTSQKRKDRGSESQDSEGC